MKGFAKRDARLYATMLKMCLADDKDGLVKLAESIGFKTENSDPYVIYKTIIILFGKL